MSDEMNSKTFVAVEEVDWDFLEKLGVTKEQLDEMQELENLLAGRKTNLVPIKLNVGGLVVPTEARISLYKTRESGELKVKLNVIKREPDLNSPFMGHKFTPEDRKNLLQCGNLGRQVELTKNDGTKFNAYLSVDPQTNDLIPVRVEKVQVPRVILGTELTEEQHQALVEGKAVEVAGLKSNWGGEFTAILQVSAERRGVEMSYGKGPQSLSDKFHLEKNRILQEKGVPRQVAGVTLSMAQRSALLNGAALYVEGLKKKGGGEFNSWLTYDKGTKGLKFNPFNPNAKKQSDIVTEAKTMKAQIAQEKTKKQPPKQTKNNTKARSV